MLFLVNKWSVSCLWKKVYLGRYLKKSKSIKPYHNYHTTIYNRAQHLCFSSNISRRQSHTHSDIHISSRRQPRESPASAERLRPFTAASATLRDLAAAAAFETLFVCDTVVKFHSNEWSEMINVGSQRFESSAHICFVKTYTCILGSLNWNHFHYTMPCRSLHAEVRLLAGCRRYVNRSCERSTDLHVWKCRPREVKLFSTLSWAGSKQSGTTFSSKNRRNCNAQTSSKSLNHLKQYFMVFRHRTCTHIH